jgi:hypothetical protein
MVTLIFVRECDGGDLVVMSSRGVQFEWKLVEVYDKGRTLVTGKTYCSG